MDRKTVAYKDYIESGVWRCGKSPTGAHHWVEVAIGSKTRGLFICIWCEDTKKFPITYEEALRYSGDGKALSLAHEESGEQMF